MQLSKAPPAKIRSADKQSWPQPGRGKMESQPWAISLSPLWRLDLRDK